MYRKNSSFAVVIVSSFLPSHLNQLIDKKQRSELMSLNSGYGNQSGRFSIVQQ